MSGDLRSATELQHRFAMLVAQWQIGCAGVGMLEYHALGALIVTDGDGEKIPIGGPRQRRLMAALLIDRNSVVSVDRLTESVFAGDATAAAATTLRSYVARLRRVVDHNGENGAGDPDGRSILLTVSPGYMLKVPDESVDVGRFERMLATGRAALDRDDAVTAASELRAALAMWHGEPYAEFADEDWVRVEAQRLQELRLVAHERLVDAELACGRAAETVSELEQLVVEHPLRDGFRERLMLALYRAGRQPDALRAYQEHRAVLAEELGLDPSPALVELERRILEHDPTLLLAEPAGRPLRGYRLGDRLGIGRQGTVYAARLPGVERDLAIRVYRDGVADQPDFVRTFEPDAQRVASISHEAIVPICDYWREPAGAYLVMRRMNGGTLRDRLQQGPLPREVATALVERIGGALEAAAAEGVCHGRIAPASVLFDEHGVPYLSDFTIGSTVRDLDRDARDFAVLAAACLTEVGAAPRSHDGVPAPLRDLLTDERPSIGAIVTAVSAAEGADAAPARPTNPYKGLRAFDEPDAADFFGRERIVDELVERLRHNDLRGRLIVVVGASGSGKSSIVRAGLLRRVRAGDVSGSGSWFVTTMLPGGAPFKEFAEGVRRVALADTDEDTSDLVAALRSDDGAIDRILRRLVPDDGQLLLVIDQFEELFTLSPEDEQQAFFDGLMRAVTTDDSRLRVVATLRADFYDRPLQLQRFGAKLRDATVTVPAMSAADLEAAVIGPATRAGITVEPAVAVELVAAVVDQPAALPSLQFTLFELASRTSTRAISRADYDALGGIDVAIAARAEELYTSLDDDARVSVRRMFERLVVVNVDGEATRRRARCAEISSLQAAADGGDVVETWVQARLLTLDRHPATREPTVEVAHEALLREWPRLRGWIDDDREAIIALGQLREASASWVVLDRDTGALYRGARLEHVIAIIDDRTETLPHLEREFLDASRKVRDEERHAEAQRVDRQARTNRRLRLLVAGIAAGLVVALVLGFVAVDQRNRANTERRVAVARELAAASVANLDTDPERSVLLALEALARTHDGDGDVVREAEGALHQAVVASRVVLRVPDVGGGVDWSPDGSTFVTEGPEESGIIDIRDAKTGASVRSWPGHEVDVNFVAFSDDGSMLATTGDDGALRVWDPASGEELFAYGQPEDGVVTAPSFAPDGERVAAGWADGPVRVFDVRTGEVIGEYDVTSVPFTTAFSPDGTELVVGSMDQPEAIVVDAATGEERFRLDGHTEAIHEAMWSPDGRWLATVSFDGDARIWDGGTGAARFVLEGHTGGVNTGDWSPDSERFVTGSDDGTARVWAITQQGVKEALVLSARDTRNGVMGVVFSPDGRFVLAGNFAVTAVHVWDVSPAGSAEWANLLVDEFGVAAFSPDGGALLASRVEMSGDGEWDAFLTPWDTATWAEGARIGPVADGIAAFDVSADAQFLATAGGSGVVDLWDLATSARIASVAQPFADDVAWNPRENLLAIAAGERVKIIDKAGEIRETLPAVDGAYFSAVDFDPTGEFLVTAQAWTDRPDFAKAKVLVWDWEQREIVHAIDTLSAGAEFAPDGSTIASPNAQEGLVELFDAGTGKPVRTLSGHTGPVSDVDFSPDGTMLATSSNDTTVRLWDARTGAQLLVLRGHERAPQSVSFSPDGTKLSSVGDDGVVRVWALEQDDLVEIARRQVTRTLTDDECRQYLHVDSCSAA